ncbi:unnamed protein product, partial [Rotaria sp. Silwood1]
MDVQKSKDSVPTSSKDSVPTSSKDSVPTSSKDSRPTSSKDSRPTSSKDSRPTSSKVPVITTPAQTDNIRSKWRIMQNFLLIWLDASIDQTKKECS